MLDLMFFVKTLALTIVLVVALQIRVGNRSVESHTMEWVQTSALVEPLNGVAHGGAKLVHDITQRVYSSIHRKIRNEPAAKPKHSPSESENE